MANQTIPVTLSWGPVSADIQALNINQLGELVARQLAGSIRADVSFFIEVIIDPTAKITSLIFNSTTRVFKAWSDSSGSYVPLTQYLIGDVKNTFIGTDQVAAGWVILDGRAFTAIPGISAAQIAVLQTLFGGTTLPVVVPTNTQNLPASASFSGIAKPAAPAAITPADGVIGALTFDATTYTPSESEALRDATETLRDSASSVRDTTAAIATQASAIQDKCSDLLTALRGSTTPTLWTSVFIGFS